MQSATGQRPIANVTRTARRDGTGITKAESCREGYDLGHGRVGRDPSRQVAFGRYCCSGPLPHYSLSGTLKGGKHGLDDACFG